VKLKITTALILLCLSTVSLALSLSQTKSYALEYDPDCNYNDNALINSPASVQVYFYIKKYAEEYAVPEQYAFAIAYQETRYAGPLDLDYEYKKTSSAGAVGPMQVMPSTANLIYGQQISKYKLIHDINLNIKTSMILLRKLHDRYKDWGIAFGAYNTGRPCVNGYARKILSRSYIWENVSE
jgi:soluble lytic murein transglycosylase-like protein